MPGSPDFIDIANEMMFAGECDMVVNIMKRGVATEGAQEYMRAFGKWIISAKLCSLL